MLVYSNCISSDPGWSTKSTGEIGTKPKDVSLLYCVQEWCQLEPEAFRGRGAPCVLILTWVYTEEVRRRGEMALVMGA